MRTDASFPNLRTTRKTTAALLGVDTKDFKKYAHHQRTIDEWAREITDVYSSTYGHWTQKRMISFNPF